jgi:predicted kinase
MIHKPTLVIFSGLPGAGKSFVAEFISSKFSIPVFAKDKLEATLVRSELVKIEDHRLGFAGYELLTEIAITNLSAGQSVALDSVCGRNSLRNNWLSLATSYSAQVIVVECICSDSNVHKARLESRKRDIAGWHELDWDEVERVRSYFEPWKQDRLVIDSMDCRKSNESKIENYFLQRGVRT